MDLAQVERLVNEHRKGLQLCTGKIKQWEKFKDDYEALLERLETFPDSLSYNVTVPFGNNAFTMGKIVHTNEVMVLLGDNWFAEVSAKQASGIAKRRIEQCTKMLESLEKEKQQFENWLNYIEKVTPDEKLVEIIEDYDVEKEKSWREKHAENVKAYRQKMAEAKKKACTENGHINSDDECLERLKSLEIQEAELNEEKEEESDAHNGSTMEYSDDGSLLSEEQLVRSPLKLHIETNNSMKSFSESETGEEVEDISKDLNANVPESSSPGNSKHVRWQDLTKQNVKKITIKHSRTKNKQNNHGKKQDPSEEEDQPHIQSPSDIYKFFGSFLQPPSPKSILKVKNSPTAELIKPEFPTKEIMPKDSSPDIINDEVPPAFTGQVRERPNPMDVIEVKTSRPVSRFKCARKNPRR